MYALLSLLFLLSTVFALFATTRDADWRWWMAFSLSSAAMMYTHNYGLFSFIGLSLFVVWTVAARDSRTGLLSFRSMRACLAAVFSAGVLYLPWLPVLIHQKAQVTRDYWIPSFKWHRLAMAWDHLFCPENDYGSHQQVRGAILLGLTVVVTLVLQYRGRVPDRLCLCLTLTPLVLAVVISNTGASIIGNRLFVLAHLSTLLYVTRAITRWVDPTAGLLLGVLLMGDGLYFHHRYQTQLDVSNHQGVRAAMRAVDASADDSVPVIVLQPCLYFSARYHAQDRDRVRLYTMPENVRHYTGAPILRPGEFRPVAELARLQKNTAWIVTFSGYTAGYTEPFLPQEWIREETEEFSTPYAFEGTVRLSKYRRGLPPK